jgi:hypothetical protein
VTRNPTSDRFTIEKLASDCLDVRFLRRKGFFGEGWVTIGASLKWPRIVRMRIARYRLILDLRGHSTPQNIRVSWTRVHLGGERPWVHCPHCERRVGRLYRGLEGYVCCACVGNPPYASQRLSANGRAQYHACKLRLRLNGQATGFLTTRALLHISTEARSAGRNLFRRNQLANLVEGSAVPRRGLRCLIVEGRHDRRGGRWGRCDCATTRLADNVAIEARSLGSAIGGPESTEAVRKTPPRESYRAAQRKRVRRSELPRKGCRVGLHSRLFRYRF